MHESSSLSRSSWVDRLGVGAGLLCALHCGLFAFAPALVALLGLQVLASAVLEWGFVALSLGFATLAAVYGYRVLHSRLLVAGFVLGGTLLGLARLGEAFELIEGAAVLAVAGGLVVALCHGLSAWRLREWQRARAV